jgi:hypothetical protein
MFRRDRYVERAMQYPEGSEEHRYRITVAYSEHLILEKYFPNTLGASTYRLSDEALAYLDEHRLPDRDHESAVSRSESAVSRNLVTSFTETQVLVTFVVLVALLAWIHVAAGARRAETG